VPFKALHYHLRHYHKIRTSFCKAIVSQYEGLSVSQTDADIVPHPGGSSPLEFLASPERGYFCPHCDCGEDVHLGTWDCMEWVSCAASETKIRQLLKVAALVLDRCEETLRQTPRVMRCWLRSWGSHFYAYPFELPQREATRARYRSYLNRFLCYVFRSWQVCRMLGQSLGEVYGLRLSETQVRRMESVWSDLTANRPCDPEPSSSSRISETLF
jgi:hypothetical protein